MTRSRRPACAGFLSGFLALSAPLPAFTQAALVHEQLTVAGTAAAWTPTPVRVSVGDFVLVIASGRVRLGRFLREVGPGGLDSGEGALLLTIGEGAGQRVGERGFVIADGPGQVRLRVYDTRHDDNTGAFHVSVIHIPASAVPAPRSASPASAYDSPYRATVQSVLRNLITLQEAFFADSMRYAAAVGSLRYRVSEGVVVTRMTASQNGWSATASHVQWPGWACAIYVGSGPPPTPDQREAVPVCFQP
jgi:hypothetical protein